MLFPSPLFFRCNNRDLKRLKEEERFLDSLCSVFKEEKKEEKSERENEKFKFLQESIAWEIGEKTTYCKHQRI